MNGVERRIRDFITMHLHSVTITCPYCWESIVVEVDDSALPAAYVEDCSVCCQPMLVHAEPGMGEVPSVTVTRENE